LGLTKEQLELINDNNKLYELSNSDNSNIKTIYLKPMITINADDLSLLTFLYNSEKILFHKRFIWKKTKVCLCTIIKNENLYIIDYINHYKALGYNHLYIYDNNDINGENVEDLIKNYIKEGFVTLINYRGYRGPKNQPQNDANYDCYEKHYKEYDWLSFFDLDEYLILTEKGMKIQTLLDNERYKRLEKVDKFLLNKLDNIKNENDRNIFYNTGYEMSNDYYLVERNLLREPDPPISDKILLERKRYDKTGFFKNFLRKKKGLGIGKNLVNLNEKDKDKESSNSIQTSNFSFNNNLENSFTSKNSSINNININNKNTNTVNNNTFLNLFKNTNIGKNLFGMKNKNKINSEKSEDSKVSSNY
jgi:hypothetical protein